MGTKYRYVTVIQGNYGQGWEDESEYDGPRRDLEAQKDLMEYRLAAPEHGHRIIRRRELIDADHAMTERIRADLQKSGVAPEFAKKVTFIS